MPDEATVKEAYDNLDFMRGAETFLTGIPGTSIYPRLLSSRHRGLAESEHWRGLPADL